MQTGPRHQGSRNRRWPGPGVVVAVALLMAIVAAACAGGFSGDDASMSQSTAADSADQYNAADSYDVPAADFEGASEGDDAISASLAPDAGDENPSLTTGSAGAEVTAQLPDLGRDIIFSAVLELASTDVTTATRNAIRVIEASGGFLFSQEIQGGTAGSSILTFKVLPNQFQAALNDLGSVGDVRSQSISADDVSGVVVDLESRINTAEASVIRLRNLLNDASELETIATLENQLLQRETTLEQLRGQLRSVRSQVDLATITVYVNQLTTRPGIGIDAVAYNGHDAGFGCFENATTRRGAVGDPITVCYRLTNTGDTELVNLAIEDSTLGASIDSLVVVDGSTAQLSPGESVLLAQELELEEPIRLRTSVTATALDADGTELDTPARATAPTMRFEVTDFEDGFPTFGEVLGRSWDALRTAAIVVALVAVAVAPFALAALIIGTPVWRVLRRRPAVRPAKMEAGKGLDPDAPTASASPTGPADNAKASTTV